MPICGNRTTGFLNTLVNRTIINHLQTTHIYLLFCRVNILKCKQDSIL